MNKNEEHLNDLDKNKVQHIFSDLELYDEIIIIFYCFETFMMPGSHRKISQNRADHNKESIWFLIPL